MSVPLLAADEVEVRYSARGHHSRAEVKAVAGVSLELNEGETLGLVGESGCGKSTLARALLGLVEPSGGAILHRGTDVAGGGRRALASLRREVTMVFQDSRASLNPRRTIGESVAAPLRHHGAAPREAARRVAALLDRVGLAPEHALRYPHQLSGGQRQRVGLARALALEPRLVVLDEPVSALDVSVQAQILNLLADLQEDLGLGYLLVAHDLGVVRQVAQRVAVMYLGRLVEVAPAAELFAGPVHPYTAALLEAVPVPDPREARAASGPVRGEPPSLADPPPGCVFHPRCPRATDVCRRVEPPLVVHAHGGLGACHHPLRERPGGASGGGSG